MDKKLYICEIEGCGRKVQIRSTIKTNQEFIGKKCCPQCKQKLDGGQKQMTPLQKCTVKGVEKRKEERSGLPEFFQKAIEELSRKPFCQNCGCKINYGFYPVNNVAHILSKRLYKSVMSNHNNRVFLCTMKDDAGNGCHEQFDGPLSNRVGMQVFDEAVRKFSLFKDEVEERGKEYFQLVEFSEK
jgi:hypothetical protein